MDEIRLLIVKMIEVYHMYGDKIGFTMENIKNIYDKYDIEDSIETENYQSLLLFYENEFMTKDNFIKNIRKSLDDIDSLEDPIEYIEFLESNNLIDNCIDLMIPSEIKEKNGEWYFYAYDGWSHFSEYFYVPRDYRDSVVKSILSGDAIDMFWYSGDVDIKDSYNLDVDVENLKYLKSIIQRMKNDFEIEQEEIDDIQDLDDIISIAEQYDIDDLIDGLNSTYSNSKSYADENEAYNTLTDQIVDFFGFSEVVDWVKRNNKSEYSDTLEIKFKNVDSAKNAIVTLYKIERSYYDSDDYKIEYDPPYHGWDGDSEKVKEYFNNELQERLTDYVDKYIT